jgi:hypothetical protein
MSSSPPGDGDLPLTVLVRTTGEAQLLVGDTLLIVAVPMLVDLLDVMDEAGDGEARPSPASSRLRLRGLKLSARRGGPREMEGSSIHRVTRKESRNRTFLIAAWSVPRIHRFWDGSVGDGEAAMRAG